MPRFVTDYQADITVCSTTGAISVQCGSADTASAELLRDTEGLPIVWISLNRGDSPPGLRYGTAEKYSLGVQRRLLMTGNNREQRARGLGLVGEFYRVVVLVMWDGHQRAGASHRGKIGGGLFPFSEPK